MRNKWLLGIAAAAILITTVALIALAATPAAEAKGKGRKIQWSQERVKEDVLPGESVQATVEFTPSVSITNARLKLTDSLSETVTVDPTEFAQLDAGTPYQVTVTFTAPATGDRASFNGVLGVRGEKKLYSKPLKLRFGVEQAVDDDDDDDDDGE